MYLFSYFLFHCTSTHIHRHHCLLYFLFFFFPPSLFFLSFICYFLLFCSFLRTYILTLAISSSFRFVFPSLSLFCALYYHYYYYLICHIQNTYTHIYTHIYIYTHNKSAQKKQPRKSVRMQEKKRFVCFD